MVEIDGKPVVTAGSLILEEAQVAKVSNDPPITFRRAQSGVGPGMFAQDAGDDIFLEIGSIAPEVELAYKQDLRWADDASYTISSIVRRLQNDWKSGPVYEIHYQIVRSA